VAELLEAFGGTLDWLVAFVARAPIFAIAAILFVTVLLRFLPREQSRRLRAGFFILAPIIACVALAAGFAVGVAAFLLIMFGPALLYGDLRLLPWFTMLIAVPLGPAFGLAAAVGVAVLGDRLLGRV